MTTSSHLWSWKLGNFFPTGAKTLFYFPPTLWHSLPLWHSLSAPPFLSSSLTLWHSLLLSLSPPPLSNHRRRPRLALSPPSPRPRLPSRLRPLSSLSSALASRPLSGKIHSSLPLASLSIASLASPRPRLPPSLASPSPSPSLSPPLQDNTL